MSRASQIIQSMREAMTMDQKVKAIRKKGNILTFKKPLKWKGDEYKQILITQVEKSQGSYRLHSEIFYTQWAKSLEELTELIDWKDWEMRVAATKELRSHRD